ncbi:chromate transporter [Agaricicola taiwanensis]|uniref:Chromate transporter n=1 Tax=Agaricicola taiwanensis TaxID=591372 RepID=A0A8J2YEX3_9RHOB|nr:chromate transporter [Agaricicola taiwanensis]GGE27699.1 chromate transporter [Agaricicola taiwanensis]
MNERDVLLQLALQFLTVSLLAIGGAAAVIPEIHRGVVETHQWMSSQEFANLFALAQAAPGPNVLVVTVIGWRVAGLAGALVATGAMTIPAFGLAYFAARFRQRWHMLDWYKRLERGAAPVTIGLIASAGCLLTLAVAQESWMSYAITAGMAAVIALTRLNPLIFLGVAAGLGLLGLV